MIGAVNRLGVEVRRGLSQFAVGSKEPSLGFDFIDNTYLADGTKNLSQAITHSRSGNATMTDGYGPELVTNGDFSTDSDWTKGAGVSISSGVASVNSASGITLLSQDLGVAQKTIVVSLTVSNYVSGILRVQYGAINSPNLSDNGTYSFIISGSNVSTNLTLLSIGGSQCILDIDNISVREMPAIKWAPHNLLTYSEDFSNAAWTEIATGSGTIDTTFGEEDPDGGSTAIRVEASISSGGLAVLQHTVSPTLPAVGGYTLAAYIKSNTGVSQDIYFRGNGSDIDTTVTVGTEWSLIELNEPSSVGYFTFGVRDAATGNASSCDVTVAFAHVYRSDLGGMVDNPERGDSYVPTAARPFGPELVTNGTFDSDISGWVSSGSYSWVDGELYWSHTNLGGVYQPIPTVAGGVYEISFSMSGVVNSLRFSPRDGDLGGTQIVNVSLTDGDYKILFTALSSATVIYFQNHAVGVGGEFYLDNVSVRQSSVDPSAASYLPRVGHHVYNGDAWVNEGLLHESEARTNLIANSITPTLTPVRSTTGTGSTVWVDGSTTMIKVIESADSGTHAVAANPLSDPSDNSDCTVSVYAAPNGRSWIKVGLKVKAGGIVGCFFDIENGIVGTADSGVVGKIQKVSSNIYRCSITTNVGTGAVSQQSFVYTATGDTVDNYVGDASSGVDVAGWQLETGSTPSSYIPTSGATVTRAAETLTVPAANLPWPYPEVIGDELVTNGTFDTDTGWTKGTGWSISGGVASCDGTQVSGTNLNAPGGGGLLTVGKPYLVTFDITSYTSGSIYQRVGSGGAGTSRSSIGTFSEVGVAQTNGEFLFTASSDFIGSIDNISVREINPLSVSIQMDGRMTYADENTTQTVKLYRWREDVSNFFQPAVFTDTIRTGLVAFEQFSGGVYDSASTSGDYYSPDVLVPYNIASRHGSTFVNGAVDGVALTENDTPVALPDLSATDLDLGFDYMGTIGTFRVWDQDLGDDGIVTASAPSLEPSLSLTFDGSGLSFTVLDWSE